MSSIKEQAEQFFDACETGKGWETCRQYCQPQATFSAQADALAGVDTLEAYTGVCLHPCLTAATRCVNSPWTRIGTTWRHTAFSEVLILARVGLCLRRGSESRRTTSTSWNSRATRFVI